MVADAAIWALSGEAPTCVGALSSASDASGPCARPSRCVHTLAEHVPVGFDVTCDRPALPHGWGSASQRRARRPGMKAYSPPRVTTKRARPCRRLGIGRRGIEKEPAVVVRSDDRVPGVAEAQEGPVVDPLRLDELELPLQVRADEGEHQPPVGAVVLGHAVRQAGARTPCRAGSSGAAAPRPRRPSRADWRAGCATPAASCSRSGRRPCRGSRCCACRRRRARGRRAAGKAPGARRCASGPSSSPPAAPRPRGPSRSPSGTGGTRRPSGAACGRPRRSRCGPAPRAAGAGGKPPISSR